MAVTREEEDVAGQDPHAIQREIEHTRAELAETIDAIADRVSPKRVASRSAARLRTAVHDVLHGPDGLPVGQPMSRRALPPSRSGAALDELRHVAEEGSGSAFTGSHTYTIERQLRTDRVLIAVGVVAAVAAVALYVGYGRQSRR
jgi:hypothetical protein